MSRYEIEILGFIYRDSHVLLTLEPLHHVDLDTIPDVVHIANTPPFVVLLVNQTKNRSRNNRIMMKVI